MEFRAEINSNSLDKFAKNVTSGRARSELNQMLSEVIENDIFVSLRNDFARTRRKGDFSPGGGTPVKTGRLQRSLTTGGRSSIAKAQRRLGTVTISFGTTLFYAPRVERKYRFMNYTFTKIGLDSLNKVKRGLPSRIRAALRRAGVS